MPLDQKLKQKHDHNKHVMRRAMVDCAEGLGNIKDVNKTKKKACP